MKKGRFTRSQATSTENEKGEEAASVEHMSQRLRIWLGWAGFEVESLGRNDLSMRVKINAEDHAII